MRMFTRSTLKNRRRDRLATPQQENFMYLRFLVLVLSVFSLPFAAGAADWRRSAGEFDLREHR